MKIDDVLEKLNPDQRAAVLDDSRAALVNAHVGSGKTTVLIAKTLYEHTQGVPLRDMVVLTFTNKAANEIRERMIAADPDAAPEDMLWFGTFHSVALKMLQTLLPVENLGYTPSFSVLDPDELVQMAQILITERRLTIKYKTKLAKRMERVRAGRARYGIMKRDDDIQQLLELLREEKIRQNKMDFDDLIENALRLLPCDWSPKWVIVDEFQDCNGLQMRFIRALASEQTRLFAVGDPNQVIYSWRGGGRDIFYDFRQEYKAKVYSLPVNYRSSATILDAAKCFLEDGSRLEGVRDPGGGILVQCHYNPFQEAEYLADKIGELHQTGVAWQDIAVFYRLQRQSGSLADALSRKGIPFRVSARKTLRDIPVLQWFVRLLCASVHECDRNSLLLALTDTEFGAGLTRVQAGKILAGENGNELYDKIKDFPLWAEHAGTAAEIYGYFGLDRYLSPTSAAFQENKGLIQSLLGKIDALKGAAGLLEDVRDFLNSSVLYGLDFLEQDDPLPADAVQLMTLHACKGLEFRYVFIIGVNHGLIPLHADKNVDQEEEKRLFFVGITRAKDTLELSYYTDPGDPRVFLGAGGYLSMIPRKLLVGEEKRASETDLQAFRRMILESRDKDKADTSASSPQQPQPAEANERNERIVRHTKYGLGRVVSEDADTYTVVFEQYGEKSFSKDFCPPEFIE